MTDAADTKNLGSLEIEQPFFKPNRILVGISESFDAGVELCELTCRAISDVAYGRCVVNVIAVAEYGYKKFLKLRTSWNLLAARHV